MGPSLTIACDNYGSQLTNRMLDAWEYENDVRLDFIRLGKPVENAYIFYGRQELDTDVYLNFLSW